MWEFWRAEHVDGDGTPVYGGRSTDLSHDPGYFPRSPGWGAAATGLPLLGGLIRIPSCEQGHPARPLDGRAGAPRQRVCLAGAAHRWLQH